ncbi:MAG: thiamine-phosphate kinase [Candidatus Binataceae bacterium]
MARAKRNAGEFELIARLCSGLEFSRRTILGPGDDCAILRPSSRPLLFTIDSMVENVHFRTSWFPPEALGHKALAVNLSDIAAMGAEPLWCVINLAVREGLDTRFFTRLYRGVRSCAEQAGLDVVGGNVTGSAVLAITIAVIGEARGGILTREAARPGDDVFVTGTLGDAAAGLQILEGKLKASATARRFLVERFLRPAARLSAGKRLAAIRPVPAAIDISDGFLADLGHILERSGAGAEIEADSIPLSPAYRAVLSDDLTAALSGGEDYELLFCTRPGLSEAALTRRLGAVVHRVGRIVKGRGRIKLTGKRVGRVRGPAGFDQLRSRS